MDEVKKEVNKVKRTKNDLVKNIVQSYLQKRNYSSIGFVENIRIDQQIAYTLVKNEVSRPNSILYSCYNSDPLVIDHNFSKFISWVKDLVKNKNICHDIEYLVAPLYCHLYLDILKGGHSERASTFFKAHLPAIDKTKCDDFVRDLINLFTNDSDATCMTEQFRSNKYHLELSSHTLSLLKKFVAENCHVIFLHILQTWFDLQEVEEQEIEMSEETETVLPPNGVHTENEVQELLNAIKELEKEPKNIFQVKISQTKESVNCGVIKQTAGLIAYNQNSILHLRPIHSYDSIMGRHNCQEIRLTNHSKQIYTITISPDCHYLVTGAADSHLCIYDLIEMSLVKQCSGHLGPIYCTAVTSNSAYVASGSYDTTARLWNIENGANLRIFSGHTQAVTSIDFHPNCLYLATGSADRNIILWSIDDGSTLRLFHGSNGIVYGIAFSPLGDTLISSSDDKILRLWDILNAKVNYEIKYKGELITKMVWSKNGKQICTGSIDGSIKIWDLGTIQENQEPSSTHHIDGKILGLEYSLDYFACVTT